ncbi:MAG: inositol monophosphatase [Bacteroidetes bacterium]|nr:inositol monophosphatase [Bacteroidota bacterium]
MDLEKICKEVIPVVKTVGLFIKQQRITFNESKVEFKGGNDLVSYVDKTAEEQLVKYLQLLLPEAGFITEENTIDKKGDVYNWIIDPLDGTTNFVHGLPCYCVSVGLAKNNKPILGVIYEINLDECFYAWEKGGAYLNNKVISVTNTLSLSKSLIATGFPYDSKGTIDASFNTIKYLQSNSRGVRRLGSAAADMAYVACGRLEAFYQEKLNAWDIAAGVIIVQEAGGVVTDFEGGENYLFGRELIASNRGIQNELKQIVFDNYKKTTLYIEK